MLAFTNATLIDGTGATPRLGESVLVGDDGNITAVGRFLLIPDGTKIIDLAGMTLMPGLIESHAHIGDHPFFDGTGLDNATESDNYKKTRDLCLEAGVTTIRSCGDWISDTITVRNKIDTGQLTGPRFIVSGKSFMRKEGHPAVDIWAGDEATIENCGSYPDTPEEARKTVREFYEAGVDFIKIIIGDSHIIIWPDKFPQLAPEIIEAIIDESHNVGLHVACHVDHLDQAKLAVDFGADEIHHLIAIGTPYHDVAEYSDLFYEMCKKNIWLVPTIAIPRLFEINRLKKNCPTGGIDYCTSVLKSAYEFGVPFGMGCDAGCPGVPWGKSIHTELAEYVHSLGMTTLEAIKCATYNNARMVQKETEFGSIRAGAGADLIVLEKSPADDIANIASIQIVVRNGEIVIDNR
jgi:enamidase